ncbi:acyl-CoA dehydrogenase family protein [Novosphingobium pentaromativorans]|nr:acyl-CoA dehydrogenase family protein [Novosphingobium pentaromativorans]AIT81439.1 acyl-CoA dehydrogenase [Novosphingobium pentaromativorans US6-1]
MELEYSAEHRQFAEEVDAFLRANWRKPATTDAVEKAEHVRRFRALATEQGYLYRGFPRHLGGSEQPADAMRAQIIRECFERARAPMEYEGIGVTMLAPTLLERGADWQKEEFIPGTLSGEIRWAQGYSEPNAGSDLASLATRGELRDGLWHINGHKIWTTRAYECTHMFALVRTEPGAGKHDGISYLLLKLDQPGVTIRRIHQISGQSEFCEVFLDDVTTPADWIVGERGEGWKVSRTTLKHERNSIGGVRTLRLFESLVRMARKQTRNGKPVIEDPVIRERILEIEGHVRAQMYSGYYQMTCDLMGEPVGIHGLTNKLAATEIGLRIAELATDIIGEDALAFPEKGERSGANWLNQIFGALALSIAGGASNIQRNLIAERGLDLPRVAKG